MTLTTHQEALLVRLYGAQAVPLDRLPYTAEFEVLCDQFNAEQAVSFTRNRLWCHLIALRKSRKLPPRTRHKSREPSATEPGLRHLTCEGGGDGD